MIGFLYGVLLEKTPDSVILDVGGVGYEIVVPVSSICALAPRGEKASLFIHTHVREDAIKLFGFASLFDRKVFESLLSVNSVGPKVALSLLGPLDGIELCHVVQENNLAALTTVPGVGARTAERLVLELKPKLSKLMARQGEYSATASKPNEGQKQKDMPQPTLFSHVSKSDARSESLRVMDDLRTALQNMGYKDKQVGDALAPYEQRWKNGEEIVLESSLREILRKLSGHVFAN
jgi:Holliday junction DNA helicase RuvA